MDTNTLQKIRDLISNNKTDLALKLLKTKLIENYSDNDNLNLITIQEANYNSLKKRQMLGSIDSNEFNISLNKINVTILNLIGGMDSDNEIKETIIFQPKSEPKSFDNER